MFTTIFFREIDTLYGFRDNRDPLVNLALVTEKRWLDIEEQLKFLQKQVQNICDQKGLNIQDISK